MIHCVMYVNMCTIHENVILDLFPKLHSSAIISAESESERERQTLFLFCVFPHFIPSLTSQQSTEERKPSLATLHQSECSLNRESACVCVCLYTAVELCQVTLDSALKVIFMYQLQSLHYSVTPRNNRSTARLCAWLCVS